MKPLSDERLTVDVSASSLVVLGKLSTDIVTDIVLYFIFWSYTICVFIYTGRQKKPEIVDVIKNTPGER